MPNATYLDRLLGLASKTDVAISELVKFVGFQATKPYFEDGQQGTLMSGGPYWRPLDAAGYRAQARAIELYERFDQLASFALRDSVPALLERYVGNRSALHGLVSQQPPFFEERGRRLVNFRPTLAEQMEVLRQAAFRPPETLVVPDTNVVLWLPGLQDLACGQAGVTVVLVPTVLRELDRLKMAPQNEELREKANGAVRRIKEMRRRGDLLEGVPLEGTTRLRAEPVEPKTSELVAWLDPSNMDDRLLASAMAVARRNLAGETTLVTRDVNLQNKAALAEVPFAEPPK